MSNYLAEAFRSLQLLEEDEFTLTGKGLEDFKKTIEDDIALPVDETIIDTEADSPEELQATYVGKVILECDCCHSRLYKNEDEVVLDEETQLANIEDECPVCGQKMGYTVLGKIEAFNAEASFETEDEEPSEDDIAIEDDEKEEVEDDLPLEDDEVPEEEKDFKESFREALEEAIEDKIDLSDDIDLEDEAADEMMSDDLADIEDEPGYDESLEEGKHGKLSDKLRAALHKDMGEAKVCEKCGKAPCECDKEDLEEKKCCDKDEEKLEESVTIDMNAGTVTADSDEATVDMTNNTVELGGGEEPAMDDFGPTEDEMIAPLDDEDMSAIEANEPEPEFGDEEPMDDFGAEEPVDDFGGEEFGEEPIEGEEPLDDEGLADEFDDVQEESFNALGNNFMKRIYENVNKFVTTNVLEDANGSLVVEGLIRFNSGVTKKTSFVFTEAKETKRGKVVLEGYNKTFATAPKAFKFTGSVHNKQYVAESMIYNYYTKQLNESNEQESVRVYGRVKA